MLNNIMVDSMFTTASSQLAAALRELRLDAGLTQRQLAQLLGREQNYIARLEQGQRRIDLVELIQFCRACRQDPQDVISAMTARLVPLVPTRHRRTSRPQR